MSKPAGLMFELFYRIHERFKIAVERNIEFFRRQVIDKDRITDSTVGLSCAKVLAKSRKSELLEAIPRRLPLGFRNLLLQLFPASQVVLIFVKERIGFREMSIFSFVANAPRAVKGTVNMLQHPGAYSL